jgi:hypothetical protein
MNKMKKEKEKEKLIITFSFSATCLPKDVYSNQLNQNVVQQREQMSIIVIHFDGDIVEIMEWFLVSVAC